MGIEERLRESLGRHAGAPGPSPADWETIGRRLARRRHRALVVRGGAGILTVGAFAGVLVWAFGLGGGHRAVSHHGETKLVISGVKLISGPGRGPSVGKFYGVVENESSHPTGARIICRLRDAKGKQV